VAPQVTVATRRVVPSRLRVGLTPLGQTLAPRRSCPSPAIGSARSRISCQSIPSRCQSILGPCRSVLSLGAQRLKLFRHRLSRPALLPPTPAISGKGTLRRCRRSPSRRTRRRRSRCSAPRLRRHASPHRAGPHLRVKGSGATPQRARRILVGAGAAGGCRRSVRCCSPRWLPARCSPSIRSPAPSDTQAASPPRPSSSHGSRSPRP
jgi:hypothetical protein